MKNTPVACPRWLRFVAMGLLATASYFVLGLFFYHVLLLPLLVANTLAYVISFAVSYIGQTLWTFKASGQHRIMLPKFAATQAVGLLLNSLLVAVAVHFNAPYSLAMIIACAIVSVVVYLILKVWVYRKG